MDGAESRIHTHIDFLLCQARTPLKRHASAHGCVLLVLSSVTLQVMWLIDNGSYCTPDPRLRSDEVADTDPTTSGHDLQNSVTPWICSGWAAAGKSDTMICVLRTLQVRPRLSCFPHLREVP